MKLRHLLFGVLAGVAFVACTNDNEPAGVTPVDGNKVTAADKYITVNLQFPGSGAATRSIDDQNFEAATDAENAVSEAAFLFFKDDAQVADPFVITVDPQTGKGTDANGDAWEPGTGKTKNPVVVIKNPTAIPTSLVVLINSGKTADQLEGKTIANLQADIADYATGKTESGKFVMSNSVYVAGDDVVIGAPVGAENIRETAELAKTAPAPVNVYVERVVAKVVVNDKAKSTADAINSGVQGVNVSLQGWGFAYQNTTSSLIKNLSSYYSFEDSDEPKNTATWANWNDPTNHRSYWADPAPYDNEADNTTWEGAKNKLDGTTAYYTQEHIEIAQKTIEQKGFPTAIVVSAALTETVDGEEVPVLLYKHKGVLYREDGFKQFIINGQSIQNVYFKADPEAGVDSQGLPLKVVSLEPDDFTVEIDKEATGLESYESKVYLSLNNGVVVYDADRNVVTDAAKTAIANVKEIVQFWNGASYYYVPIVQNDALNLSVKKVIPAETEGGEATKVYWGLFGVVRNHIYQVNINKVQGLGTPVADPKEIIYPEIPKDEDYYIAATINILEWKKVTQEVNLGE